MSRARFYISYGETEAVLEGRNIYIIFFYIIYRKYMLCIEIIYREDIIIIKT